MKQGDKCVIVTVGNRVSKNFGPKVTHTTITNVGRKYFYVSTEFGDDLKFRKDNHHQASEYSAGYKYYPSESEYRSYIIQKAKKNFVVKAFRYGIPRELSSSDINTIYELLINKGVKND